MPIPFLVPGAIAAAALATATTGVVSGAKAIKKNKNAKRVNENANQICKKAETQVDLARKKTQKSLEDLGERKLNVLDVSINRFVNVFEQIHSIHINDSTGLNELKKLHIDKQEIAEMQKMSMMAGSVLGGIAGGAGAGALAAFGAYGATMTFATASTGTAIASLSGAAATNATLAFLGGGALAAGGGGMALGSVVLGGALAGPAIAVLGIVMNASASKNLDNAYSNIAKAREYAEGCKIIETLCGAITARANLFSVLISKLDKVFTRLVEKLEDVVQTYGTDYSTYPEDAQNIVAMTLSVVGALKKVLDTPILDEAGNVTIESQNVHNEIEEFAEANKEFLATALPEYEKDIALESDDNTANVPGKPELENTARTDALESSERKDQSIPNAAALFYSMPAVRRHTSDMATNAVIKEFKRLTDPDALTIVIYGKVLEGKVCVGSYCKLEGEDDVFQVVKMGRNGKLTERIVGQATEFALKKI